MSALTRCARYARIFNHSIHTYSRAISIHAQKSQRSVLRNHNESLLLKPGISTRLYATTAAESTADSTKDLDSISDKLELRKIRKKFKYSEDFPASTFWKKYDHSMSRKVFSFHDACKNIYFAMVSQKGISASEFHDFMSLVEQRDDFTEDEIKLILKTLGFLNKEVHAQDKVRWTEYLTRRFISLGIPLDVTYYNQVLRNYLQISHTFSPVEFMSAMEKQGVAPNAITLSRFVIAYCKMGDIKSASQILEHMRSGEMSINAKVYNSLILGNFIAGDKATAMQLFREAGEMGFNLDAQLYHSVIVGLALMGDLDGVKELVKEADEKMIVFSDGAYSAMIEQVAPTGREDILDYFLDLLTKSNCFYYNECLDTLPVIMEKGSYDFAYKYFRGLEDPSARLFYKAALLAEMAPEDVVKYHRQLVADNVRDASLSEYFALAIAKFQYEPALAILPHFKTESVQLRPHYLWPLIRYHTIMEDLEGLKKLLPYIETIDSAKTIQWFLLPSMKILGVSADEYKKILKKHSQFNTGQINACVIHHHLNENVEAAVEYAKSCGTVEDLLGEGMQLVASQLLHKVNKDNWQNILGILSVVCNRAPITENSVIKNILNLKPDLQEVKRVMLEKGLTVDENALTSDFKDLFSEQELEKVKRKKVTFDQLRSMSLNELLAAENMFPNSIFFRACLLDKSFKAQRWDIYQKILQMVNLSSLKSMPHVVFQAARYYALKQNDLTNCVLTLDILKNNFSDYTPNIASVLSVVKGLCDAGRHEDAVQLLSRYSYRQAQDDDVMTVDAKAFFNMEVNPQNIRLAKSMLDTLKNNGYSRSLRNACVGCWNFISSSGDLDVILNGFEFLKVQHNFFPLDFGIAFSHFIKKGDKPGLQTAYDKFTDVVLEQSVLLSLAAAFVENGQIENAKKTLHTPGMRIMANNLKAVCQRWAAEGKNELIEEFSNVVGDLPGKMKRSELSLINLRAMCNKANPDVDAVIRFFETKFDEDELEGNLDACRIYANFLKAHNRKVPFDKFTMEMIAERRSRDTQVEQKVTIQPVQKQKETQTTKAKQKVTEVKESDKKPKNKVEEIKAYISEMKFTAALQMCRSLTTDEIRQSLPEDFTVLQKWAVFLMNRYHVKELESIPSDKLQKIIENELTDGKKANKYSWVCQKWRYILEKAPDSVLSCLPEMPLPDQTNCFASALFTNDMDKIRSVKKVINTSDDRKFIHEVFMRIRREKLEKDFGIHGDLSKKREMFFNLLDTVDSKETKAFTVSYILPQLVKDKDEKGLELLTGKVKSNGMTFETIAKLLPSMAARNVILKGFNNAEEMLKDLNKPLPEDMACARSVIKEMDKEQEVTDLSTEKAVTDVVTEIDDKTNVVVAKDTPVDVTVAKVEKTEVVNVKKEPEEIVDTAKIVSGETEFEMKDKAGEISDKSTELGSKSETEKKTD